MVKEISSKSLSSHDEIVTNLELSAFGLMLLSDYEPKTERDKNLWQGLFFMFFDLLEQHVHDLRLWDSLVRSGQECT